MFNRYIRQFFLFFIVGLVIVACDNDSNPIAGSLEDGLVISGNNTTVAIISIESHAGHDSDHDEEEHADPVGFELVEDGALSYAYRQLDLTPDGSISINVGETKEFTVHFLDCENLDQNDCLLSSDCEWDSDENTCHETGHVHCDELDQSACDLSDHCEWHTDDNACEEEGHEHCDELDQSACDLSDHCEWHADDNACEEEEHGMHIEITGISQGSTTFQIQLMHDGHSDYTSIEIPVIVLDSSNSTSWEIDAGNYYYSPTVLEINVGDDVTWNNVGGFHDVVVTSGPEMLELPGCSGPCTIGTLTFNVAGSYDYICSIGSHAANGMIGTINVSDPVMFSCNTTKLCLKKCCSQTIYAAK